jgi:hypothetical protein
MAAFIKTDMALMQASIPAAWVQASKLVEPPPVRP